MSQNLNTILSRIENQLSNKGVKTQRDIYENAPTSKSLNYKPTFSANVFGKEDQKIPNYFLPKTAAPSYFNAPLFSTLRQPQVTNEQETRKLIEHELDPYVNSIKKELDVLLNNIHKELTEHKNISNELMYLKDISIKNKNQIAILENEINNIKSIKNNVNENNNMNENNNINENNNMNENINKNLEEINFLKMEINEMSSRLNDLTDKNNQLEYQLQLKNNIIQVNPNEIVKESENKLYRELNILQKQFDELNHQSKNENIFNIKEEFSTNINELRDDFKEEINKIQNEIDLIKTNISNNEPQGQLQTKLSSLENKLTSYDISASENYKNLQEEISNINNENIQLKLQLNALSTELSNQIIKGSTLKAQQNESDNFQLLVSNEGHVNPEELKKIKNEFTSTFNSFSNSIQEQFNKWQQTQIENNIKVTDNINEIQQQIEEHNYNLEALKETDINNFNEIESGFMEINKQLEKFEQKVNNVNILEQGMYQMANNVNILSTKLDEELVKINEWKEDLEQTIRRSFDELKTYCDLKSQK